MGWGETSDTHDRSLLIKTKFFLFGLTGLWTNGPSDLYAFGLTGLWHIGPDMPLLLNCLWCKQEDKMLLKGCRCHKPQVLKLAKNLRTIF